MKKSTVNPVPARERPGLGGAVVYWLLLAMAFSALTPCVLLPEWRAMQALELTERAAAARTEAMRGRVADEQRMLDAMQKDPGAMARLAQRDLRLRRPDERQVPVGLAAFTPDLRTDLSEPTPEPLAVGPVWPDLRYDRYFCDPQTRPIIMGMSVGLAAVAFLLFGRRPSAV